MVAHEHGAGSGRGTSPASHDIHEVLNALGLTVTNNKLDVCPFCDEQGRAQVYDDHVYCHHPYCRVWASPTDLMAHDLGIAEPDGDGRLTCLDKAGRAKVRKWVGENLTTAGSTAPRAPRRTRTPAELRAPFASQVKQVWDAAKRLPFCPATKGWLRHRGLDPELLRDLNLARPLPGKADAFPWCSRWKEGHRLISQVFDARGEAQSLRARWVHLKDPPRKKKTAVPKGWGRGALRGPVLANPMAVKMLRGEISAPITLIVAEGEPDFLTWATTRPDLAVIGVFTGAWSTDIANRVPDGSTVIIRTHHDEAGHGFATKVGSSLAGRVTLLRSPAAANPEHDTNDLHLAGLLPNDPMEGAVPFEVAPATPMLPGLVVSKEGKPLNRRKNVRVLLEHHPRWKGRLWFDCFRGCYRLGDEVVDDAMMNALMVDTGEVLGVQFSERTTREAVVYVGRKTVRHPLAEWLRSLVWDCEPRLHKLLPRYFGTADNDLHRCMGAWWMMQAVARPLHPGCQADYTLVLIGKQGPKKSSAVRALAMRSEWFHETKIKLGEKDALQALQGCWIMELAELSALRGTDVETIKSFLTSQTDRFRVPYGAGHEAFPRSAVFVGTTNDRQFLKDPTGNRRFWPVDVGTIDIDALERDREQLWAEAVHRLRAGERRWPTEAEERELDIHRRGYEYEDPWTPLLVRWLKGRDDGFTTADVMVGALDLHERDMSRSSNRVGALLRSLGYERVRKRKKGNKRVYVWVKVIS